MLIIALASLASADCAVCNETCSPCGGGCTATSLSDMFDSVTSFDTVVGDITGWNTSCITDLSWTFYNSDFNQDISNWDTSSVTTMFAMFYADAVFNQPIGSWNTSSVTDMHWMFVSANAFNQPIGSWDVSHVTAMYYMFNMNAGLASFNQDLSAWNTSSVTDMSGMFYDDDVFNGDISSWDTSSVTDINNMFNGAVAFNQPIGSWDVSHVTDMALMFYNDYDFNQPIGSWNVSSVNTMRDMFDGASSFDQDISLWNTSNVTDMHGMFANAIFNQNISLWNVGNVIDMSSMFAANTYFNQPIGSWNTSGVITMNSMFYYDYLFDQDLSGWDTGSVTDMSYMFEGSNFNQSIGSWDTKSVTNMGRMFASTESFNQDIGLWNTSAVTDMSLMFSGALAFNQDISGWDTHNVNTMFGMFYGAEAFNQPIGSWDTSQVTDMSNLFANDYAFNQSLDGWNTSSVIDMNGMFYGATNFNQNISGWDTHNVQNFGYVFFGATSFNQPIGSWNTSSVTVMGGTFYEAISFDQNIGLWDVSSVTNMNAGGWGMFYGVNLSVANYDALLNGWAAQSLQLGLTFDGGNSQYSSAALSARNDTLIGVYGWTITDGGYIPDCISDSNCSMCQYCAANGTCQQQFHTDTKTDCGLCQWCDGAGSCSSQSNGQDIKNECPFFRSCDHPWRYTIHNGNCDGANHCGIAGGFNFVSAGNVCINSTAYNVNPTATVNCGVYSDCIAGNVSADEYYVGYDAHFCGLSSCLCNVTDWQPAFSLWNATPGNQISVTEQVDTCQEEPIVPLECIDDYNCSSCQKCDNGTCVNQLASEDLKNECTDYINFACPNNYQRELSNGLCDGAGACNPGGLFINVSLPGKVCDGGGHEGSASAIYHCAVARDCVINQTTAPEYYVGYTIDGTGNCDFTDWQPANSNWTAPGGYRINVTEQAYNCSVELVSGCTLDTDCGFCQKCDAGSCVNENFSEDVKNECSNNMTCSNAFTLASQTGFCNNYGACAASNSFVSPGHVCVNGSELNPSIDYHCGVWSDCVLHTYSANEYYVGYNNDSTCNDTDWQPSGSVQSAPANFWWNMSGHVDTCDYNRVYGFASGTGEVISTPTEVPVENVTVTNGTLNNIVVFPEVINIIRQSGATAVLDNKGDNDVVIVKTSLNNILGPSDLAAKLSFDKYSFTIPAHGTATILLKSNAIQQVQGTANLVLQDTAGNQLIIPVSADLTIPGIMGDAAKGVIQFLTDLVNSVVGGFKP